MKTKKQTIKQKIMATLVVLFMMFMMFGSLDLSQISAQTVTNTNLIQNIVAGNFWHEAMQNVVFNNIVVGVATNSLANMTITNLWDLRGSGAGWSLTGYCNSLTTTAAGINTIANTEIAWSPVGATIIAISGVTTGIANGTANFLNAPRTLMNASVNNGMGNYRINNVTLNVVYNGRTDQKTGTYQATLTMTSA